MTSLLRNVRFFVLSFSVLLSAAVFFWVAQTIPAGSLQTITLTRVYALISLSYLYLALLAGPFCYTFPWFPLRGAYFKARRALGVSAFYFGLLHAYTAFFKQLGGFPGLAYLTEKYLLAIILSFTSLVILFLMTLTSFDFMVKKLTFPKWKLLHRLVYIAGIFTLIHALMLGTHFQDLSGTIPQITFVALAFLLMLEARRADAFLQKKLQSAPGFGYGSLLTSGLIIAGFIYYFFPFQTNGGFSFGIHSQHIQLAKEAQQNANTSSNIPGLQGDRTRRFTVSFTEPQNVRPNVQTPLTFRVYDAASGNEVQLFQKVSDKIVHLIIADSQLQYFSHIHPDQSGNEFTISTSFPKAGIYHLYVDFQPLGAIEQQFAFTLNIGNQQKPTLSTTSPDTNLTKTFGEYTVSLEYPKPLRADQLSVGQQLLTFNIKDKNGAVTTLKPYLAAFGHLVMINQETFAYVHVHPRDLTPPTPDANGGPTVEFMPLGLYGPIKPGIYRIFAQFNPDSKLFTADFTIKIE